MGFWLPELVQLDGMDGRLTSAAHRGAVIQIRAVCRRREVIERRADRPSHLNVGACVGEQSAATFSRQEEAARSRIAVSGRRTIEPCLTCAPL